MSEATGAFMLMAERAFQERDRLRLRNAALVEALRASRCPVDIRVTTGECQQCGCCNGLLIKSLDEQSVTGEKK